MPEYNGQEYRYEYNAEYGIWGSVLINSDYIESLESLVNRESFYGQYELLNRQWAEIKEAAKYAESFGLVTYYRFKGYNEIIFRSPFNNWDSTSSQWSRLHNFAKGLSVSSMQFDASLSVLYVTNPDISESNPDLWAYYQNTTKHALAGSDGRGIRTQIKYGKLLKKLFPMATDEQISAEVESWKEEQAKASLPLEYVIATDSESFKLAYQGDQAQTLNPKLGWPYKSLQNSCMRYSTSDNWSDCDGFHPAQAYASGSFAIVYATQGGRIAGRAIVPYDKETGKLCGVSAPIYTTSDSVSSGLRAFIESNGASFTDDSYGVCKDWVSRKLRLCRIELDNGALLMPYVDCIDSCEDTGKALLLTDCGDISCRPTEGYSEIDERETCHACDERVDSEETRHADNGYCYCESCYDERFFYCDRAGETVELDDTTFVCIRSRSWSGSSLFYLERVSDSWRDENCAQATDNGEWYESDECIFIQDETYSPNFADYGTCEVTQELFLSEDLAYIESHGIHINLDLLKSDKAWQYVNGQWQLAEGYEFTNLSGTSWDLISFEDVEPDSIESEYAIAAE